MDLKPAPPPDIPKGKLLELGVEAKIIEQEKLNVTNAEFTYEELEKTETYTVSKIAVWSEEVEVLAAKLADARREVSFWKQRQVGIEQEKNICKKEIQGHEATLTESTKRQVFPPLNPLYL